MVVISKYKATASYKFYLLTPGLESPFYRKRKFDTPPLTVTFFYEKGVLESPLGIMVAREITARRGEPAAHPPAGRKLKLGI